MSENEKHEWLKFRPPPGGKLRIIPTKIPPALLKVAIVVLVFNGERVIEKCLESVFKSDYTGPMEVVVVDNASTDGSREAIGRFVGAHLTNSPGLSDRMRAISDGMGVYYLDKNRGWAGGNNYGIGQVSTWHHKKINGTTYSCGIDMAKGEKTIPIWDLALFLNDDVEIRPDMISELVKAYEKRKRYVHAQYHKNTGIVSSSVYDRGIFGCKLLYPDGKVQHLGAFIKPTGHTGHLGVDKHPKMLDTIFFGPDYVTGAAMMITRECWDAMGGFPECYFMYYEEVESCVRARKKGYETVCVPSAVATHLADEREGRSKFMFYLRYEKARLRYVWRNYSLRSLLRWFGAERRWYRDNIKGVHSDHADATRKAYSAMWWRLLWILMARRSR